MKRFVFVLVAVVAAGCTVSEGGYSDDDASVAQECTLADPCIKAGVAVTGGVEWLEDAMMLGDATDVRDAMSELIRRSDLFDDCLN